MQSETMKHNTNKLKTIFRKYSSICVRRKIRKYGQNYIFFADFYIDVKINVGIVLSLKK